MNKDIAVVTGYIMFYDLLELHINGSFFSKIDTAIELAEEFVSKYPPDYDWAENDFEETIESFLKSKDIII
jgi:hypothetical protein